jgi:transcriptional regulator with XRE-family HTH domain
MLSTNPKQIMLGLFCRLVIYYKIPFQKLQFSFDFGLILDTHYFTINKMNTYIFKSLLPQVGQILRVFREKSGHNLSEVANKASISVSMLSQIERGLVSPSIDTLLRVCAALEFDVVDLFRRISRRQNVSIRHQGGRLTTEGPGAVYEQLIRSPEGTVPAELLRIELTSGKTLGMSSEGHEGIEMGYVLAGAAKLTVGLESYDLSAGDSIAFFSHVPHTLTNNGPKSFVAIWSAIPPHRDYLETERTTPQTAIATYGGEGIRF